jgi:hypothetical protein
MARRPVAPARTDGKPILLRREAARRLLGDVPSRTFSHLEEDRIIAPAIRGGEGKPSLFDAFEIARAYIAYLKRDRPGSKDREARARRDETLADLNVLRLQQQRGELVPVRDVVREGQAYTKAWAAKVLALPARAERLGILNGNKARLDALCREVLDEIARWDVGGSPSPSSPASTTQQTSSRPGGDRS